MLKDVQISRTKPAGKRYRLKDAHGLFIEVMNRPGFTGESFVQMSGDFIKGVQV